MAGNDRDGYDTDDEAIAAAKTREWVDDFDGKNCDECAGWDGQSRRCACGNRRVYWEASQYDGRWFARATAY